MKLSTCITISMTHALYFLNSVWCSKHNMNTVISRSSSFSDIDKQLQEDQYFTASIEKNTSYIFPTKECLDKALFKVKEKLSAQRTNISNTIYTDFFILYDLISVELSNFQGSLYKNGTLVRIAQYLIEINVFLNNYLEDGFKSLHYLATLLPFTKYNIEDPDSYLSMRRTAFILRDSGINVLADMDILYISQDSDNVLREDFIQYVISSKKCLEKSLESPYITTAIILNIMGDITRLKALFTAIQSEHYDFESHISTFYGDTMHINIRVLGQMSYMDEIIDHNKSRLVLYTHIPKFCDGRIISLQKAVSQLNLLLSCIQNIALITEDSEGISLIITHFNAILLLHDLFIRNIMKSCDKNNIENLFFYIENDIITEVSALLMRIYQEWGLAIENTNILLLYLFKDAIYRKRVGVIDEGNIEYILTLERAINRLYENKSIAATSIFSKVNQLFTEIVLNTRKIHSSEKIASVDRNLRILNDYPVLCEAFALYIIFIPTPLMKIDKFYLGTSLPNALIDRYILDIVQNIFSSFFGNIEIRVAAENVELIRRFMIMLELPSKYHDFDAEHKFARFFNGLIYFYATNTDIFSNLSHFPQEIHKSFLKLKKELYKDDFESPMNVPYIILLLTYAEYMNITKKLGGNGNLNFAKKIHDIGTAVLNDDFVPSNDFEDLNSVLLVTICFRLTTVTNAELETSGFLVSCYNLILERIDGFKCYQRILLNQALNTAPDQKRETNHLISTLVSLQVLSNINNQETLESVRLAFSDFFVATLRHQLKHPYITMENFPENEHENRCMFCFEDDNFFLVKHASCGCIYFAAHLSCLYIHDKPFLNSVKCPKCRIQTNI